MASPVPEFRSDSPVGLRFSDSGLGPSLSLPRLILWLKQYESPVAKTLDVEKSPALRIFSILTSSAYRKGSLERMRFNEAAQAFNTKRQTFPTVMIAGFFGDRFHEKAYFKAQEGAEVAPKVKF